MFFTVCAKQTQPVDTTRIYLIENKKSLARFLCKRLQWVQGDYIDDAGLDAGSGFGTDSGLAPGRHVRYNYNNYTKVHANDDLQEV